jgi:hypothetical protein
MSTICLCVRRAINPCGLQMLQLRSCRRRVTSTHSFSFHRRWIMADSVRPSVEGNVPGVRDSIAANDRLVHVRVADDVSIHAHHRGVVCESTASPFPANEADAHVAEPVVDSAVIPDTITPVAIVEPIMPAIPSPPRRSPKRSLVRRRHPFAGHPVVAVIAVGPVTRNPHPTLLRTHRLLVDRQNRWSNANGNGYTRKRRCRSEQDHQRWQKPARTSQQTHRKSSLDSWLVLNKYAFSMTCQGWPKAIDESTGLECRHE